MKAFTADRVRRFIYTNSFTSIVLYYQQEFGHIGCFRPVIPATQVVETGGSQFEGNPGKS
jgi:hypothetical protein